jgi:hypothetical protein
MVDEAKANKGLKADNGWEYVKNMEIWDDELCLFVLNGNKIPIKCDEGERLRIGKCILYYC